MDRLTVLYDPACALCVRCRTFMESQPAFVDLEFVASRSPEASFRFGQVPWLGEELCVVSDLGDVWAGPAAFVMCLWALIEFREWSYWLTGDTLAPMATRFFHALSSHRRWIAAWFDHPTCSDGSCRLHPRSTPYR